MADPKTLITREMQAFFGADQKRIDHALKVAGYAEEMLVAEGGDREVVMAAALLHDIGIQAAEKKYGSTAGKYQEIEGPPLAKSILEKIGFPEGKLAEVLEIIAHHHSGGIETINFKIIWDADWLVNIPNEVGLQDQAKTKKIVDRVMSTATGKQLSAKLFFSSVLAFIVFLTSMVFADTESRFRSNGRDFYYFQTYVGPAFSINKNFELDLSYAFNYTKNGSSWAGKSLGYLDGIYKTNLPWLLFAGRGRFENG